MSVFNLNNTPHPTEASVSRGIIMLRFARLNAANKVGKFSVITLKETMVTNSNGRGGKWHPPRNV